MTTSPLLPPNAAVPACCPTAAQLMEGQCRRCLVLTSLANGQPQHIATSLPVSSTKQQRAAERLTPPFMASCSTLVRPFPLFVDTCGSGQQSRGESSLELEAIAAVHQFAIAVQSIAVSEMLPRTPDLIFVNLTTLDGQPYCLELTAKGWRVTSLRSDCMQGDFTRMELFTQYYESLHDLMDSISPDYRERFSELLAQRLEENNNRRPVDGSSGPMSVCSDDGEEFSKSQPPCAFCRRRSVPTEDRATQPSNA